MYSIYHYETIDSTNTEAKRLLQACEASRGDFRVPVVIVADEQTAGRGRQGKSFYSPKETGLYMSVVDEMPLDDKMSSLLTVKTSMAVANAIYECTGVRAGIKWVNDIYINNRKVCGILTEAVTVNDKRYVIIGIGINISTEVFPSEISRVAGSLGVDSCLVEEKKKELCRKISENILSIKSGAYDDIELYRRLSLVLGHEVEYNKNGKSYSGIAIEITETGGLAVDLGGARDILQSGEISLKKWG